jgi:hypothetical protein
MGRKTMARRPEPVTTITKSAYWDAVRRAKSLMLFQSPHIYVTEWDLFATALAMALGLDDAQDEKEAG